MVTTFDLVKIFFKERFLNGKRNRNVRNRKNNSKGNEGYTRIIILVSIFVLVYGVMFVSSFTELFKAEKLALDNENKVLYMIVGVTNISALFFILMSGNNLMFSKPDVSVLCTLPVDERKVVIAKLIIALISDTFFDIFIGICGAIAYFISCDGTLVGTLTVLLCPILAGVVPICFFSFLIIALKRAVAKSKARRAFELIGLGFTLVFVIAFSVLFSLSSNAVLDPEISGITSSIYENVLTYYPFLILVKLGLDLNNALYFFLYLLSLFIIGFIFVMIFTKYAYKMMIEPTGNYVGKKSKETYKKGEIKKTLLKKEFGRLFQSNTYIMNSITLPIIIVILFIVMEISMKDSSRFIMEEFGIDIDLMQVFSIYFLLIGVPTMITPAYTISLESKQLWIPMTLPIDSSIILKTKRIFNYIIQLSTLLLLIIAYMIIGTFDILFIFGYLAFGVGLTILSTPIYQLLGLHNPSIGQDDLAVIKQSKAVMFSSFFMIGFMILVPGLMVVLFIFVPYIPIVLSVFSIISIIIGILLINRINKVGPPLLKNYC